MELSECTLYPRAAGFAEGASQGEAWSPNLILERREEGMPYFISRADARSRSHTPAFGSSEVSFHIPGSLSPSLKILRIITKKQTYKRALERRYLERTCVHACIQLCTRGYTVVYTRVHSSLLGRRYSLGILGGIHLVYLD